MAGPMPPQGPQAGPAGPPPGGPPDQAAPIPKPDQDPQGQSPAMQAVSMANDGLMKLGEIFASAKGEVSPEEQKQLAGIIQSFQSLIQSLSGESEQGQSPAAKPAPGGPMPAMSGKDSTPMDQG